MEEPIIKLPECNGCTNCVEDCPTNVFDLFSDHKARVVEPGNCIDCHICEAVCPTNAIRLVAA